MTVYEIAGGVILLVVAVVIIVLTLLQHTHGQGLAGAIGGNMQSANSTRLSPADQMLAKITRVAGLNPISPLTIMWNGIRMGSIIV